MKAKLTGTAKIDFKDWEFVAESNTEELVKQIQIIGAQVALKQIYDEVLIWVETRGDRAWVEALLWEDGPSLKVDLRALLREALDPEEHFSDSETVLKLLKEVVAEGIPLPYKPFPE